MVEDFERKTEAPTTRRRQRLRQQGWVARSLDLTTAIVLLASTLALYYLAPSVCGTLSRRLRQDLGQPQLLWQNSQAIVEYSLAVMSSAGMALLPLFASLMIAALLGGMGQVGWVWAPNLVRPDLSRLSVSRGFARILSGRSVWALLMSAGKLFVVLSVAGSVIYREIATLGALGAAAPEQMAIYVWSVGLRLAVGVAVALLILAALDLGFQHWWNSRSMRMTPQELLDERRETEGDPQIRAARRRRQRAGGPPFQV